MKNRLMFQQKASRAPLSREECEYWLEYLPKILKIGTEFEIQLPSPTASLKVKDTARCVHSAQPCVTDCVNLESCLVERYPSFCATRESGTFLGKDFKCPAKEDDDTDACKKCDGWSLLCRGLQCASHTPLCSVCPSFSRVGETVENADVRHDADTVRSEMRDLFQPSEFVGTVGKYGALSVIKDGSLTNGGIEVPTVGRRVHWNSFYNMCKGILDPIIARGGFVDERTGQHFHVLTGYFQKGGPQRINELEKPIPEIVLANLHQLHRRYELAMFWMMSCGTKMESLTRWARFRQSMYKFSALGQKMSVVQKEMAAQIICMGGARQDGKYASVAYHFCRFDEAGDVDTLHFENRIADGCLSPAVVSAWAMMCYALVLKAVRLSQYGIMEVGDEEYGKNVAKAFPHLIDGGSRGWEGSRFADTSGIGPSIPFLQESSANLIQMLKPELSHLGPSFQILMELAERPCSIRLTEGDTWDKIESDLHDPYKLSISPYRGSNVEEIMEIIDLASICECSDVDVWIEEVSANLGQQTQATNEVVQSLLESGRYRWSEAIGSLMTT